MIPQAEILALRGEWGLRDDVIEKDYVLGWLLAAIGGRKNQRFSCRSWSASGFGSASAPASRSR